MYIWTYSTPNRDCSFDAGVIIHEYTHSLSSRLTGGPANSACLNVLESGGMGEGWSDFMAISIMIKTTDSRTKDYPLVDWVYNNPAGIRAYLYSTSLSTNPLTYKSVNSMTEEHAISTTWASILYEALWNLIDKYGITGPRKPTFVNGTPTDGRFLSMKIVMDGMAHKAITIHHLVELYTNSEGRQPCNPNFVHAQDAIIDADKALTGGRMRVPCGLASRSVD
jgi:extracellular elastinolytic metalloproteinase